MFCLYNNRAVNIKNISYIVYNHYQNYGYIYVHYQNGGYEQINGQEAINVIKLLCPDILKDFKDKDIYYPNAWALNNLIGCPLKQIFIWMGFPDLAEWIYSKTLPSPKIIKK